MSQCVYMFHECFSVYMFHECFSVFMFYECFSVYMFHECFSVYMFPVPEDKSGQQVVDSLQRQVEQLGAVKTGNFCVDCETYQSNQQVGRFSITGLCKNNKKEKKKRA